MLYLLLYPFKNNIPGLNLIGYITFRAAMAAAVALAIGIFAGPPVIRLLKRIKFGQPIRGQGIPDLYEKHKGKAGTPTMGGVLILISMFSGLLLFGDLSNRYVLLAMFVTLYLGCVGFADDWLKLRRKHYKGLAKKQKLIAQCGLGILVGLILYIWPPEARYAFPPTADGSMGELGTRMAFPFLKTLTLDLGWLYILFVMIVIVSTSNAVNLTDGLDGLAIGCTTIATISFSVLCYIIGRVDVTKFLNIPYVAGAGELTIFCTALFGAGLAFLWYNSHPAEIFMGDTGSLALGGALGIVALLIKQELLLPIIGGIFVAEALSVVIQVFSFRVFGRRVFRMSPIHHHFEMLGMHEAKIIARFLIVAAILGVLGLASLKMR